METETVWGVLGYAVKRAVVIWLVPATAMCVAWIGGFLYPVHPFVSDLGPVPYCATSGCVTPNGSVIP